MAVTTQELSKITPTTTPVVEDREAIAARAQALTAPTPVAPRNGKTITSDVLSSTAPALKLPPIIPSTAAAGTQEYIASQNKAIQAQRQAQLDMDKESLRQDRNNIGTLLEEMGNSGRIKEQLYKEQGVDEAKKDVDDYTSQIEAEQVSNNHRIDTLRKNAGGMFGGAVEGEIERINRDSISKQADLAVLQNASLRKYSTAAEIADRQLEAKLEPMKAKLEALKFFYSENKADFNKEDDRLYSEIIKQQDREYEAVVAKETANNQVLKDAVSLGAPAETIKSIQNLIKNGASEAEVAAAAGTYTQLGRNKFVEDRGYNRGVLESDRTYNRGVLESDRSFSLQSKSLVENPDGSRSIVNVLDGSSRKVQGNDYWSLYNGITGYGSSLWDKGVDADLKIGDPVFSPAGGEVIDVVPESKSGGFGNMVKIRTDSGEEVWLSHLQEGIVSVGQRVEAGDAVGIGGNTGNVIPGKGGDGSHLDFTVKDANGNFMSAKAAALWANKVYQEGQVTPIAIDKDQRARLMTEGLDEKTINAVLRDAAKVGLDQALGDGSGLNDTQRQVFSEVLRGKTASTSVLNRASISKFFGIEDNDKRSGFMGWWGETNQDKLDGIMEVIEKYRAVGYSDEEIMKMMKDEE